MSNPWTDLKNDKKSALIEIYQWYYAELYNYGMRISQDEEITRDCIHDLFIELWSNRFKISHIEEPKHYIFKMFRFITIDALKKRNPFINPNDSHLHGPVLSEEDMLIDKELSLERSNQLKLAMQRLSKRQKEIIYLRFYSGLSYNEISKITALKYQSIRNHFSNALKELRKILLKDTVV
ncbi:sigma-70 family RNA polymerase sigma factor [Fulvivirgaceae bacterium BMA12]|uniref:Sigma-70 family RNA polymerase sigma factor n=1 Tax=Agaribacillus aureus TaxID=3051825 RepID=A0ABT8LHU5_9BACT|nr:sigma-70 family RNA polymerase sigma factor [Fulvivirgaceae bacterium BMA12]